jgi:hypothetical protein
MDGDQKFTWESGTEVGFTNWVNEDNGDGKIARVTHPCVFLDAVNEHKWNDVPCETKSDYIAICNVY